jgi:regulatory protein
VTGYSKPRYKTRGSGRNDLNNEALRDGPAADGTDESAQAADYLDLHHACQKAYRLLALRPRSVREIEKKLREKGFPAAIIKEALEKLHDLKYLDDVSFASQWTRHLAVNNLWGNRKIIADLQLKGVAARLIDDAIDAARSEMPEEEAIVRLIKKKMAGKISGMKDIKEKKRIFQSLLGRGFPAGLILSRLKRISE